MTHEESRARAIEIRKFMEEDLTRTVPEACKKFDCSTHIVYKACMGIHRRHNSNQVPHPNSFAVLRALVKGGAQTDVAKQFVISRQRVGRIINAAIKGGWDELKKLKRGAK